MIPQQVSKRLTLAPNRKLKAGNLGYVRTIPRCSNVEMRTSLEWNILRRTS